jgi:hypothetical protein
LKSLVKLKIIIGLLSTLLKSLVKSKTITGLFTVGHVL